MPNFALTYQGASKGLGRGMSGAGRPQLRVVGGNDTLVRMARVSREARWPPLRLVGEEVAAEIPEPMPVPALRAVQPPKSVHRRAAWSQALLAGLMVVMLSSVGQAIAAHW